ncbi:MAG: tetratricopeptide repeat protein [Bryobacteraceae bacterium]
MWTTRLVAFLWLAQAAGPADLFKARDRQDVGALQTAVRLLKQAAAKSAGDANLQYRLALAGSVLAEVALERGDRTLAQKAAEEAIPAARRAVELRPEDSEHHRILGVLCGQVIPGNLLLAAKYARCAASSLQKAIELAPNSAVNYLSRGIGSYYLPAAFGGGVEPALQDFRKAIELDGKSAEAYLWLGIALRKAGRNGEARKAFQRSLELNPNRIWTKQQLAKTPAS